MFNISISSHIQKKLPRVECEGSDLSLINSLTYVRELLFCVAADRLTVVYVS